MGVVNIIYVYIRVRVCVDWVAAITAEEGYRYLLSLAVCAEIGNVWCCGMYCVSACIGVGFV